MKEKKNVIFLKEKKREEMLCIKKILCMLECTCYARAWYVIFFQYYMHTVIRIHLFS